jgi:tetrahydromethanopterin S-methyltransferase subunit G
MARGRPRKQGPRTKGGRLRYDKLDARYPTALIRVRDFGVSVVQSVSPFAGHLAGVLYLRGLIEKEELGRFHSYLQMVPTTMRAIQYGIRVSGREGGVEFRPSRGYWRLCRKLGRDIDVLHQLAIDRLICPVSRLRHILSRVPLTPAGSSYIQAAETHQSPVRLEARRGPIVVGSV